MNLPGTELLYGKVQPEGSINNIITSTMLETNDETFFSFIVVQSLTLLLTAWEITN